MKRERMKKALVPVGIMLLAVAVFVMIVLDLTKEQFKQSTKSTVAMGTVVTEKLYGKKTYESVFDDIEKTITELENENNLYKGFIKAMGERVEKLFDKYVKQEADKNE